MTTPTRGSGRDPATTTDLEIIEDDETPDPDADFRATQHTLRALGRFGPAAELVRAVDAAGPAGTLGPAAHALAGRALTAVSEYAAAQVHLLLASADPDLAPEALAGLAELAWVQHDHARGRAWARAGLALDPSHHGCREQLRRNEIEPAETVPGGLAHVAVHAGPRGDAGERTVSAAVRRCFTGAPAEAAGWYPVPVQQLFDEARLAAVNATAGLVVGGGGLFAAGPAPNGHSGWQWNVPDAVLARIDVPLVVLAVGGARVDGPGGPDEPGAAAIDPAGDRRFDQGLRRLAERAVLVGLRDRGSVDRVRDRLPAALAERVGWQPCPTSFIDLLPGAGAPDLGEPDLEAPGGVLLNCDPDRAGWPPGGGHGRFLRELRDWVVATRERADVRYAAYGVDDERFVVDLRREHGITLPVVRMYDLTPARVLAVHRRAALVVGMHEAAATIPVGCGTPIARLAPGPEEDRFLADIGRPQWGLDVREPRLGARLGELTAALLDDAGAVTADVVAIRARLAAVAAENLRSLPAALRPARVGAPVRIGQDSPGE